MSTPGRAAHAVRLGAAMALALGLSLHSPEVPAEDLRGADQFLCASLQATVCFLDGDCASVAPVELNVPQFILVNARTGMLKTTPASGANRESKADAVRRANEHIILHGHEHERAYSLLINETTGLATFASVADERSVIVFAACTPMPGR